MDAKPRILIVGDEPATRDLLEALLSQEGYEVLFAAGEPEALATVEEVPPDAILLDDVLPGTDGSTVCRKLRADPACSDVPILLVTAADDRAARTRGIASGADDFVNKPLYPLELRARVRTSIRLNRCHRLLLERTRRQGAEEIHGRSNDLAVLTRVITAAASTSDLAEALRQACASLAKVLGMPLAAAALFSEDWQRPSLIVRYQNPETPVPPSATPIFGPMLLRQGQAHLPVAIVTAATDPRLAAAHPQLWEQGIRSLLVVPIQVRGKVVGSIELSAKRPMEFTDNDFTVATSIATAIGHGMENNRLYQELMICALGLAGTVAKRSFELQKERDCTQGILEALSEAVLVADTDGKVRYVNPAAESLTGYRSEELIGQEWGLQQCDPSATEFHSARTAVQNGERWSGETIHRRRDGTRYHAAVTVAPLFEPGEERKCAGFVSVHRDITRLKEAERLKDEFISNVSHELRTPLSVVTLLSANLDTLHDRLSEDKRRQMVQDIRLHIRALNDVVEDVLQLSQMDGHGVARKREPVNLAELTREEVEKQQPLAQRKAQDVRVSGVDVLPVWGNKSQLRQVIRNLLNNAIKYTPIGGSILCECSVVDGQAIPAESLPSCGEHRPLGPLASLRVSDTGVGVDDQDLPHIFERFYRVKAHIDIPGTGLGLAIAQELVSLHNGYLAAASVPKQGTTFTVLLPLHEEVGP